MTASSPAQLPFVPRPFPQELFSSWLLRVARANCVSLEELTLGFHSAYPKAARRSSLDTGLDAEFLKFLAHFCRLPVATLRRLTLETHMANLERVLFLRCATGSSSARLSTQRLGYGFCPSCITQQSLVHVPWEWSLACLLHCPIHGTTLLIGCPACGDPDPLPFGSPSVRHSVRCETCSAHLLETPCPATHGFRTSALAVEQAYRATLFGASPNPALLGEVNGRQLRLFVDDLVEMLSRYRGDALASQHTARRESALLPRDTIMAVVSQLVWNASSNCDAYERRKRSRRSLKLWSSVLSPLAQEDAKRLEVASRSWPPILRRRFASAFAKQIRKFFPGPPFRRQPLRPGFPYKITLEFRDLSAVHNPLLPFSGN